MHFKKFRKNLNKKKLFEQPHMVKLCQTIQLNRENHKEIIKCYLCHPKTKCNKSVP